jgi:hypothetical protein
MIKKFMIVCIILFIAGVGCKKANIDGGGLCGCSFAVSPDFHLVIKNQAGEDLLSETKTGAYTKSNIELFRKDDEGRSIPVNFSIRPPFSYGNEKFKYYQLYAMTLTFLQKTGTGVLYLKLDKKIYELSLELNQGKYQVERMLIDKKAAEKELGTMANFASVFYLVEQ